MEARIRRIFVAAAAAALSISAGAKAQEGDDVLGEIISPDLERREIREAKLDTENIELSAFGGIINVEDFGSNSLTGAALAYHINEDLFMEAAYGETELGESSFERLSGSAPLLTEEQRTLSYYNLSLGWNLFPGEYFIFDDWALNSSLYLIGGVGNTSFADEEHFTYNFGVGARVLMSDWLALRLDFRDHVFEHEIFGELQTTNNLSAQLGFSIFF
ncbi:outer membrane beta-barrel domain-containing protein [Microbulbifer thermotolerans]|uniref:Outer membrane beta-barrel domain-containing protein n=1 Tax=Microbulbifer thermotolerans TaxID=252514 RepID=A0A143HR15_MICTH|nr:outer membrane beta-barrel domain-containing protein [Microbulbifer thermotolerans]AMX03722.1 outer membrane beta-barrel domain-containing protein [Microbulbifer thermotolerans]MCX2780659.1 outer membrane beta-barrel domain-containing protein [Microbulbifer thermotolerans]MCX2783615.1 outer membrane beta-barrel domain-containing protein [Microbulbifer thermotolerans]MCX2795826.1 outer membrane beta-barrel domain-containing protein [Microbulbifer thermotolerans]MCX2801990.1 outer membrane be